jgi:hypothetical protein
VFHNSWGLGRGLVGRIGSWFLLAIVSTAFRTLARFRQWNDFNITHETLAAVSSHTVLYSERSANRAIGANLLILNAAIGSSLLAHSLQYCLIVRHTLFHSAQTLQTLGLGVFRSACAKTAQITHALSGYERSGHESST